MMNFTNNTCMRTKRPIATISYLSEGYLSMRLNEALDDKKIVFWAYILHKGDKDLQKEHFHVYAEPAKTIDTLSFNVPFVEFVSGEEKPRKCLEWQLSKFDDWYLYVLHDERYLSLKGQSRNFHYLPSDIWVSDLDELDSRVSLIDYSQFVGVDRIIDSALADMPLSQAIQEGIIPVSQLSKFVNLFRAIKADHKSYFYDSMEKYRKEN